MLLHEAESFHRFFSGYPKSSALTLGFSNEMFVQCAVWASVGEASMPSSNVYPRAWGR